MGGIKEERIRGKDEAWGVRKVKIRGALKIRAIKIR